MKLDRCFFTIILCVSAGVCRAQIQDDHPSFPICGGVSCEECIPLERQTAPGIGLDLSLSYGTAAINFQNGTTYDVPLVQGNSMYQAAMKDLVLEAKLSRTGRGSELPAIGLSQHPDIPARPVLQRLLPPDIFRALRNMFCPESGIPPSRDQWVNALAIMLQALKNQIEYIHGTQNTDIWLSVPDFAWNVEPIIQRLREAATQAGLDIHRRQLQGLAAMKALHGIDHCWDDACDCEDDRRHPSVLVVDHSNQTLGLSLYKRHQGMLETEIAHQKYYFCPYGHNEILQSDDEPNFEQVLRRFLASIDGPVDRVVLTGNGATDAQFWSVLRTVFEGDGVLSGHSYPRDAQSHTFASARQVARQSRLSNMGAFLTCEMPERCFHGMEGIARMEIYKGINKVLYERKSDL
jgi:hypothetical protein